MSCGCNASNLFLDLATYCELESHMYGGPDSVTWFVAAVQKSNWHAFLPISLRHNGCVDFNQRNVSASLNRSGDYVLNVWFRCQIPRIELTGNVFSDASIRWTRNFMHNLFEKCSITFNELCVHEFDSYWLDFNHHFRTSASKVLAYKNMIGDVDAMTSARGIGEVLGTGSYMSVVLPFFFAEDTGIALPVAALPFNDIKINYHIRRWQDMLIVHPGLVNTESPVGAHPATCADIQVVDSPGTKPTLIDPQTFAHYAVVHNDERLKMGDAPRDLLIHQVQAAQYAPFKDISSRTSFDIRLSHSVVSWFYAAQNITLLTWPSGCGGEYSNYTTGIEYSGYDPIAFTSLLYESTCRVAQGSDYYSMIHPFLYSTAIGDDTGYHMYSHALHPWDATIASGSTNFGKLSGISINHDMSPAALASAGINTLSGNPEDQEGNHILYPDASGNLVSMHQKYRHIFLVRNWNIGTIFNGSFGHPSM